MADSKTGLKGELGGLEYENWSVRSCRRVQIPHAADVHITTTDYRISSDLVTKIRIPCDSHLGHCDDVYQSHHRNDDASNPANRPMAARLLLLHNGRIDSLRSRKHNLHHSSVPTSRSILGYIKAGNSTRSKLPSPNWHSNIGSGISIATDIMPSLAPTIFLWKLKRPRKEKILVGAIMGLGMFASVASLVKATLVKETGLAKDAWALTNSIATWTALEQILIMIASSAPFLKPLVQSALNRMGWTLSGKSAGRSGYGNRCHGVRQSARQSRMLNKSAVNSRRDIYGGYEDPFASGDSNDTIPLEGKVYEVGKPRDERDITTMRTAQESFTSGSWTERGSEERELTPSHAV